jgi:hypothetical protein
LRRFQQGRTDLFDYPASGRPLTNDRNDAFDSMLAENPLGSWKVLRRNFRIGKTTCLWIVHDKLV